MFLLTCEVIFSHCSALKMSSDALGTYITIGQRLIQIISKEHKLEQLFKCEEFYLGGVQSRVHILDCLLKVLFIFRCSVLIR